MGIATLVACVVIVTQTPSRLIEDLGVESPNNSTTNTAAAALVRLGDKAVPDLAAAINSEKEQIRHYAIRCLGMIGTRQARLALIEAARKEPEPVQQDAVYALTWKPHRDATAVYVASLARDRSQFHHVATIHALEAIPAKSALPRLDALVQDPRWRVSYAAYCAQRTLRKSDLEVVNAASIFRSAKYGTNPDVGTYEGAVKVLRANKRAAMRDLVDILLTQAKAQPSGIEPSAESLIGEVGAPIFPVLRQALQEKDEVYARMQIRNVVHRHGWQAQFPDL